MRIKTLYLSLLMAFMGMAISSCSHDDEKDIPCDDCGKTRIQVVCEGADGVVSRGGSFVGGKVTGAGVYESDYGRVTVQATADAGYYVSYFRGGPTDAPNQVDYAGTGETTYSTKADTNLGNHMFHIGFKKMVTTHSLTVRASLPAQWEELLGPNSSCCGWKGEIKVYLNGKEIGIIKNDNERSLSQSITINDLDVKVGDKVKISGYFTPYSIGNSDPDRRPRPSHFMNVRDFVKEVSSNYELTFMLNEATTII